MEPMDHFTALEISLSPVDISPGDADVPRRAEQTEPVYAAALVRHPGHGLRGVQRQAGQGGGEGDREQEVAWIVTII